MFCLDGRRPKSSRAGSHHINAAQDVWSGENLTESPLQESGAELLRQNTARGGRSGVGRFVLDRHPGVAVLPLYSFVGEPWLWVHVRGGDPTERPVCESEAACGV